MLTETPLSLMALIKSKFALENLIVIEVLSFLMCEFSFVSF